MTTHKGSRYLSKGVKRTALSLALGACFIGGVQAQSNTAGAITGRATAGDTITVTNPNTGFSRTLTVSGDGSYRFSALPTGQYTVTSSGGGSRNVTVNVGVAASADFVSSGGGSATTLDAVQVVGSGFINPIDVSSVESTTILTAEQIARVPVARDATSVALLAPGTVRGDAAFGNLASFGGSSVAENQYFLNGFNITNTFANLAFTQVPFEALSELQVKTGGYGAEFGRSTGGVMNMITKRGTNEFHAGGSVYWEPESLRETKPNQYDGYHSLISDNSKNNESSTVAAVWASGALIKDKLFGYALLQYGSTDLDDYPGVTAGGQNFARETKRPNWLVKLDWNINDNNILEFTALSDKRKVDTDYYTTSYDSNGKPQRGTYLGVDKSELGGEVFALKYTGYLTENFTLTALAGQGKFSRSNYNVTADGIRSDYTGNVGGAVGGCPVIVDARPGAVSGEIPPIVGCSLASTLGRPDAEDQRDQYRIDLEWQLGDHILRGGIDIDEFESVAGESYSGGAVWRYGNYEIDDVLRTDVVRKRVFQSGATVQVNQRAYYIEDSWSITDNFIAYLGLRSDTFENKNGAGQTYVKMDNQIAPRLGFSWDVNGDSSFKIFGNAGRYALPLTGTVAVRGASASLFSEQFYAYTGVDPETGAPTGLTLVTNPNNGRDIRYLNNEFGVPKNAQTIASQNLDPMYQDEYILGFQAQLTDNLSGGIRGIYRDLKRAIDDQCDYRPVIDWAIENGFTTDGGVFIEPIDKTQDSDIAVYNPGFPFCRLYNPGSDGIFKMDVNGDGTLETVNIPASVLGPKAKRTYSAIEFFFEGQWDKLFLQGSYTYAKSKGNTEGGVKSDIGQDDTGTTQDFDYPELTEHSYGYLPNDRRHTLKLFGNYRINDEWAVGGNLLAQSGRPVNCFGFHPVSSGYGNSYFYCNGEPMPRGTSGRTPWSTTVDLNVSYAPSFADGRLKFKLDVFNVFDSDKAVTVNEFGEDAGGNPQAGGPGNAFLYKQATDWQTPRYVRFMVQYDF